MAKAKATSARDGVADALLAEFRPVPRVSPLEAARRHWLLVLIPVLVSVPLAAFVALKRTPKYTAEARLIVGHLNLSEPGAIQGYAQAAQDLAATYPQAIDADGVVLPLARTFHMSRQQIVDSISATEVPSSAIVRLDATASSPHLAISLANAASGALVAYLQAQNRNGADVAKLYTKMQAAELAFEHARAEVPVPPKGSTAPPSAAAQRAIAAEATAQAVLQTAIHDYQSTSQLTSLSANLEPIVSAQKATSDRATKLELGILIALIASLIIGLAAATLYANNMVRRELTVPAWEPDE